MTQPRPSTTPRDRLDPAAVKLFEEKKHTGGLNQTNSWRHQGSNSGEAFGVISSQCEMKRLLALWREDEIPRYIRLCENTVHGSTRLTTNGVVSLEIEYLSVRPEHRPT